MDVYADLYVCIHIIEQGQPMFWLSGLNPGQQHRLPGRASRKRLLKVVLLVILSS